MRRLAILILLLTTQPLASSICVADLASLEQQAFSEAANAVAASVVQIRTIGGRDRVGKTLISAGPTTGLIISPDGYIVSSAFNFAGKPSSILVRLANGEQLSAELVGRDSNRMLVLLKVNAEQQLPIPKAARHADTRVGQWAIAVGRTFQDERVDVSIGIVSALNRMYGRVLQTDANVSVANYGGPLIDISGNVLGILVPMSPQPSSGDEAELAGASFYDSGIGFAVPLDHVLQILNRWKEEPELLPGKLGVGLQSGDAHVTPPEITSVWRESPAAAAGWKADDLIKSVDGRKVSTQAQLRFLITPRYADDKVQVTLDRNGESIETLVALAGKLAPYRHAFFGMIPNGTPQDESQTGVQVGLVWPDSPAAVVGVKSGDIITAIDDIKLASAEDLQKRLLTMHPNQPVTVTLSRGEQELLLETRLATIPHELLTAADMEADSNKTPKPANPGELQKLSVPEFEQEAVFYAPTLNKNQKPGLLLWLGDGDAQQNQATADEWYSECERDGLVLLIAPPKPDEQWASDDLSYLQQLLRLATRRLDVDKRRLVVLGQGKAGQLAHALAFAGRSNISGVVGIDAPLPRTLKPRDASPNNRLAVLMIESKESGFAPLIRRDLNQLLEAGYPASKIRQLAAADGPTIDAATRASIARWIFGLNRL